MSSKSRYDFLDTIRGITIISMIAYHIVWDLVCIYGLEFPRFLGSFGFIWQQSICWTFILLSGFCFNLGSKKFKRGLIVFGCGLAVTLVTRIFAPSEIIIFGVLTCIGSAMIIMTLLEKHLEKLSNYIGVIVFFVLFGITKTITDGYLGFFGFKLTQLPEFLYANMFTTYLGFQCSEFFSADYFPILPWIFLFICGYFIGKIAIDKNILDNAKLKSNKVLSIIGRYSLWIYLIHQPLIYGALYLIYK